MKNILFLIFSVFLTSCNTDLESIGIPGEVGLGEQISWLNKNEADYETKVSTSSDGRMHISFLKQLNSGFESRQIGFSFIPTKRGTYKLTTDRGLDGPLPSDRVFISFSHLVDEDLFGYEYKYVPDDSKNFLTISEVDKDVRTVKGEGRAAFVLVDKRGLSGYDLPDELLFECKFHLAY